MMTSQFQENMRLYFLDHDGNRLLTAKGDGSHLTVLANRGCSGPDGIVIDAPRGHIYWTNMGQPDRNDGSIMRCDLDGGNMTTIVAPGMTHTPKQLVLEPSGSYLYWCDREGMRVMRCQLDGSLLETLVQTGYGAYDQADARNWCVGIALDLERQHLYWTQKGASKSNTGRILRAPLNTKYKGVLSAARDDIETLFDGLPEPIDLELDTTTRTLYWTDRGSLPLGNTLNRAQLHESHKAALQPEVIAGNFNETIGLSVHAALNIAYVCDLGGTVYQVFLDGSGTIALLKNAGALTGIIAL